MKSSILEVSELYVYVLQVFFVTL